MKKFLKGLGIVLGIFIIISIIAGACSNNGITNTDNVSSSEESQSSKESKDYEFVEDPELVNEGYGFYSVKGILKNNTNTDKEYIQISFILYDEDGNNVGTAWANAEQLKAGGNWKFNASGMSTDENTEVTSFELDSVDGF